MPSPTEEPSCPSRWTPRAQRRQSGRFLLGVAALLGLVATVALGLVWLRAGAGRVPASPESGLASPKGVDSTATSAARQAVRPIDHALGRSRPGGSDSALASHPSERASGSARTDSAVVGSLDAPAAAAPFASPATDGPAASRREADRAGSSGTSEDAARWAERDPSPRAAVPAQRPGGATGLSRANASAGPERRAEPDAAYASETPRLADPSPTAATATPAPRVPSPTEVIERSKRLHERRLEALRQSGQLPAED